MAEVIDFPGETLGEVPVEGVLQGALEADLEDVLVLGRTRGGGLYAASSMDTSRAGGRPEAAIYLCEEFKQIIIGG